MASTTIETSHSYETVRELPHRILAGFTSAAQRGVEFFNNSHLRFEARLTRALGASADIQPAADRGDIHPGVRQALEHQKKPVVESYFDAHPAA